MQRFVMILATEYIQLNMSYLLPVLLNFHSC